MVDVFASLYCLKPVKVCVIGDFMVDNYTYGNASRISPEAPVPVFNTVRSKMMIGGAGNVVLNLHALGAKVYPIGRVGEDESGLFIRKDISRKEIDSKGIFIQQGVRTPLKDRLIANGQQLMRIDHECCSPLETELEEEIFEYFSNILESVDIVALSDYAKGFFSLDFTQRILLLCKEKNKQTIVDPKQEFVFYRHATIIKPNFMEAVKASKLDSKTHIDTIANKLLDMTHAQMVMITRASKGISVFSKNSRTDHGVESHQVMDVTGAGDTVLAVTAVAIASGLTINEAVTLANEAAGIAIERVGCARISLADIAGRLLSKKTYNKVLKQIHSTALLQSLNKSPLCVLKISSLEVISEKIFTKIMDISIKRPDHIILVLVFGKAPTRSLIDFLSAIEDVNYIFISDDHSKIFLDEINCKNIYTIEDCKSQKEVLGGYV